MTLGVRYLPFSPSLRQMLLKICLNWVAACGDQLVSRSRCTAAEISSVHHLDFYGDSQDLKTALHLCETSALQLTELSISPAPELVFFNQMGFY